jgi:hypothetical protein
MKIEYFRPYYTSLFCDELIYKDKISTKDPHYYHSHDENMVKIRRFPKKSVIPETYLRDFAVVKKQGIDFLNKELKKAIALTMADVCDFGEGSRYIYYSFDECFCVERWGENDETYALNVLEKMPDSHQKNMRGIKKALISAIQNQLKKLENLEYENVTPFGNLNR